METPVLLVTFNRIESTQQVLAVLKQVKVKHLYIASDAGRDGHLQEQAAVKMLREYMLQYIDWECEVKTLFQEHNLGCGRGVSTAITWFFQQVPAGIILEDDVIPHPSFFNYCTELLARYQHDKRIWIISGQNPLKTCNLEEDYYFAKIMHGCGWATWADRWLPNFHYDMRDYDATTLQNLSDRPDVQNYFHQILTMLQKKQPADIWDYQWWLEIVAHNGLCINPAKNLIRNIGFTGTHFNASYDNPILNQETYDIYADHKTGQLTHPKVIDFNYDLVERIYTQYFNITTIPLNQSFTNIYILGLRLFTIRRVKRNKTKLIIYFLGIPIFCMSSLNKHFTIE